MTLGWKNSIAAALIVGIGAACAQAAVLCAKKSGAVFVRRSVACGKKETPVNPVVLGLQGAPGPQGPAGPAGPEGFDGFDGEDGESADETRLPVAFGVVNADGSTASGTGNFTSSFNAGTVAYEIVLDDDSYTIETHTAVITAISTSFRSATAAQSGASALAVKIFGANGAAIADNFSFVVYRNPS